MLHLDLFSGIGGFAYAADQVWDNVEHIFCDNDKFCQQVIKKHWPESEIYGDIREIDSNALNKGLEGSGQEAEGHGGQPGRERSHQAPFLLTGGFPCQPFSAAGLRRGTADERHLWPEMLRVIRLAQPEWVIAENVYGLVTWDNGVQFEQVCADLEASGYEVQPFVIPAAGVGAPHKRDRVWICAHASDTEHRRGSRPAGKTDGLPEVNRQAVRAWQPSRTGQDVANSTGEGLSESRETRGTVASGSARRGRSADDPGNVAYPKSEQARLAGLAWQSDWSRDWTEVAAELCSVDDGLSVELDGYKLTKSQHRTQQLKAYGNAIVPQVAVEIMRAMKESQC